MKKILLTIISLFMILSINVNASEVKEIGNKNYTIDEIVYMCDGETYYLEKFLPIPNKVIISNGVDEKIYKDGACSELSVQDKLDIENSITEYTAYESAEYKTIIKYYDTYYGFNEGFVLNTEEFDETNAYYNYVVYEDDEGEYEQVDYSEIDKTKLNEYYVERYFKHLSKPSLEEGKDYYITTDYETFTLFTGKVEK